MLIRDQCVDYFRKKVSLWGARNFVDFPWRHTPNRFHALTAEIMLQRTRAEQVLAAYENFASRYQNPNDYLTDKSASIFQTLGLLWREKHFRSLCEMLSTVDIPASKDSLLALPGVGPYAASAFLSFHCGVRQPIIDSNIVRVYGRFFGFATTPETRRGQDIADLAQKITPKRNFRSYNYAVLDFSMGVCKPKPLHDICHLAPKCKTFR